MQTASTELLWWVEMNSYLEVSRFLEVLLSRTICSQRSCWSQMLHSREGPAESLQ